MTVDQPDPTLASTAASAGRARERQESPTDVTDLGDVVITGLLRVGLSLQTIRPLVSEPGLRCLNDAVDGLDRVIQIVRETVLTTSRSADPGNAGSHDLGAARSRP